jgi:hypothetical protein
LSAEFGGKAHILLRVTHYNGRIAGSWAAQNRLGKVKTGIGGNAEFCSIIVQFFAAVQMTRRT